VKLAETGGAMSWTKAQTDRALADIIQRAQRDPAFRKRCLDNPAAAVKEIVGQELPPGFKLRFVDNAHADLLVVLPDPITKREELSDDDLSAVSGGVLYSDGLAIGGTVRVVYTSPITSASCFAAGTPVLMADGSSRPIEGLCIGDAVLAYDERDRQVVTGRVSKLLVHDPEPIHRAVVEAVRDDLLLTTNHPFYSGGRWRQIRDLPLHSELYHLEPALREASARRLLALEPTSRNEPVYNIEVDDAHTYFANGLLVHNGGVGGSK
jgi:hypothetical protein